MKRISVLLVLTFILLNDLYSQEKTTSKEVGLYFSSLNSFGVRYKFGNEKRMFRLTALSLLIQDSKFENMNGDGANQDVTNAGAGLNFGMELPVKITDVFSFYYGPELRGSYNHSKSVNNNYGSSAFESDIYKAGIGFIIGFSHSFKSNIQLSAEIVPGISYSHTTSGYGTSKIIGFGLESNAAGITLGYRF